VARTPAAGTHVSGEDEQMSSEKVPEDIMRDLGLANITNITNSSAKLSETHRSHARPLCTDTGNAERLVEGHGANLRYCYPWGKWLVYDGKRWCVDDKGAVMRMAKDTARSIFGEAKDAPDDEKAKQLAKWATTSLSENKLASMVSLAKSEPGVAVLPEEMDPDPLLLTPKTARSTSARGNSGSIAERI